ncbi:MAG: efflux RND transporter permease subunit, partial [Candidatus Eremiobacteraeota bacterium]|nr:efflux RND transporter permease subunit [Candidatus Eremiobacteraeota bacterium]
GLLTMPLLVRQQYPNVSFPTIVVTVVYPGASTSQIRDAIVRPIEDQIAGAPQLQHINTTIQAGQATIAGVFDLSSDQNADLIEIQNRMSNAQAQLPSDLQPPTIAAADPTQGAVISLIASSDHLSPSQLGEILSSKIVPAISQLNGVSTVNVGGAVVPSYQVEVDPLQLAALDATVTDVVSTISNNNVLAPGGIAYGRARETGITVRGDVRDPASVSRLLLSMPLSNGNGPAQNPWTTPGRLVHISDVAKVSDSYEVRRTYAFSRRRPIVTLDVTKTAEASDVSTSQAVIAALPGLAKTYPDVRLSVINVESNYTRQQVQGAIRSLIEAVILTSVAMLFFLRSWRNAVVVLIAIPTSLFVTLAVMKLAHFTLDTVSLGAMTLAIGILVDDSTVVLENIKRHFDDGENNIDAAVRGRTEIGLAALTLTLVDVVIFVPIAFLPGVIGKFLQEFGLVVAIATITSLLVGFTVTPAFAGQWSLLSRWKAPRFIDAFNAAFERARAFYVQHVLPAALGRPWLVVGIAAVTFAGAVALVPLGIVGFEFLPNGDQGNFFVQMTYPAGWPLERTREDLLRLSDFVDKIPDVQAETSIAGGYQPQFGGVINQGSIGQIHVFLKEHRAHPTAYWVSYVNREGPHVVPHATLVTIPSGGVSGGPSQDIDVVVTRQDGDPTTVAEQVFGALQRTPGTTAVNTLASQVSPQVNVDFDRQRAQALNVSIGTASQAVRAAFGGVRATQFTDTNGLKYVDVIYPSDARSSLASVYGIAVRSATGAIVRLDDIAQIESAPVPPIITRQDRATAIHVAGNVAAGYELSNVQRTFKQRLAALHLPSTVSVGPSANSGLANMADLQRGIGIALLLSFVLVYLLMVALYDSFVSPFIIMFAVPVTAVGALGSLALTHQTLNMFSLIGTVLLVGLVIKNGILLVDFADQQRAEGLDKRAAIERSAELRFRPIVMTTSAMIVSMLPIALALEPGSEVRRALGIVVIGGLSSSLLLTLVLVPVVYLWMSPKRFSVRRHGKAITAPLPAAPAPEVART